ncbi:17244_t:CDS:2 [Funneliformis geosporum]|nr:17244_t:CDS:2 [Funneliformis geosporum]
MRGGNSIAPRRLARANFPGMKGYNKRKANKWLLYLDANNLYGWAMSQYLLTGGFRWLDLNNLPDIRFISPTAKRGSAWEVKLKYLDHLHPTHTEYPFCPEHRIVKRQELGLYQNNDLIDKLSGKKFAETEKLVATLETKDRVLEFDQSPWLKPYITANTIRCRDAKNAFEKDLWKLMNNAVFGKTMEDVRRRTRVDLVCPIGEERRLRKMSNLIAVH